MTTTTETRIGYRTIRHYTGARVTRCTFQGVYQHPGQDIQSCPHIGHRSTDAAVKCGTALARKSQ